MGYTLWIVFMLGCLMFLVSAGPGTHRYNTDAHSNYGNEKKNKQHIQEHIKAMVKNDTEDAPEPSEQDMIYYLFVIHDTNGDGYLDGHELRAAFTDFDHQEEGEKEHDLIPLDEVNAMVDHVLEEDDKNGDGLISWSEYLESQLYHDDDKGLE